MILYESENGVTRRNDYFSIGARIESIKFKTAENGRFLHLDRLFFCILRVLRRNFYLVLLCSSVMWA